MNKDWGGCSVISCCLRNLILGFESCLGVSPREKSRTRAKFGVSEDLVWGKQKWDAVASACQGLCEAGETGC